MSSNDEEDFLTRTIRRQSFIVALAAAAFAISIAALRFLPASNDSLLVATARWFFRLLQNLSIGYLILFGLLYLPTFIIYRWHLRRVTRWAANHMEAGAEFTRSTEFRLHKIVPYLLLGVCVLAFLLFLPLCLGDLAKGTYECRTIPEHVVRAIRR